MGAYACQAPYRVDVQIAHWKEHTSMSRAMVC